MEAGVATNESDMGLIPLSLTYLSSQRKQPTRMQLQGQTRVVAWKPDSLCSILNFLNYLGDLRQVN